MACIVKARLCAVSLLLSFVGCAAEPSDDGSISETQEALTTDVAIYSNAALASPWQNWSWSATTALSNADAPLATGSTSQIKFTTQAAWGALALARATGDLAVASYDSISFDVRGTATSSLYLAIEPRAGGQGTDVGVPVTTAWVHHTIKLSALKGTLTSFGKIDWIGPQSGQTFYIDNLKLVAAAPATTTLAATTSSLPATPLTVTKDDVVTLYSTASPYYVYVPSSYDATHKTPTKLLVWLHGCGGNGYGDAWELSPGGSQNWVTVSVGGRDGGCWNSSTDAPLPLAALADVKKRLNIDPRRVVIGGYSSGGNMAYRTAFYNAKLFAGVIAENTAPFYGTGSSQAASIAAAAWKLNVAHLAHVSDTTFAIATVRSETDALKAAGFPTTRIEKPGTHWDDDTASSGTNYDLRTYLLPYLNAGWVSP